MTVYPVHKSDTGTFQELIHEFEVKFGQLSILTIEPGCRRGGHYHKRKIEWFCCIRGGCVLVLTDIPHGPMRSIALTDEEREFVQVRPHVSHLLVNTGSELCELLVISAEEYDPDDNDTYRMMENGNAHK